ncbi:winged helix-turn-helix transcriptional regulator [Mucilaginibacter flavidus]|uniref:winged helix-turn-helix transcriptional regulator n=1 Tax=Mucilaginibacter flavidus TaxID=2949309 RepID=UPI0020924C5E|nr:helix-turn-helix domain-containing protein [Mucilaginibacter flavidus]MCO5946325.1 helix-turn-helix transcriptional regulator [Mucilaginibacter flavidus]
MAKEVSKIADKIRQVQTTLAVINGKWKLPILLSMYSGVSRFRDLQRNIPNITTRVLSKELKDLEASKLVLRIVYDTHPVSIEYKLTTYSFTLTPVVDEMIKWGKQHSKGNL